MQLNTWESVFDSGIQFKSTQFFELIFSVNIDHEMF